MVRGDRVLLRLAVATAGVIAVVCPVPTAAYASCVGPTIAVGAMVDDTELPTSGGSLAAGQPVTVSGVWFHSGCDDTGARAGCGPAQPSSEAPVTGVELILRQGSSSWTVDTRDAGSRAERYAVTWRGRVPTSARAGPAELTAGYATLPVLIVD